MMDLIDRQAEMDVLRVEWYDILTSDEKGMLERIANKIKALPAAQRWIPVTERLPEKHGEQYIVTISDGSIYSSALQFDATKKRWYLSFLNEGEIFIDIIDDVTAWMPLPEPFREGGAE